MKHNTLTRGLLISIGTLSVGIGIIGVFLPVLPTTPFLLLAAACYAKSSDWFYNRLLNNKIFGSYIKNYREGKGISMKAKVISISFLALTILYSVVFVASNLLYKIILAVIFAGVTLHILSIKTLKQ
jgi:hypothetical protein